MSDRPKLEQARAHLEAWGAEPRTRWERARDRVGEIIANWALTRIATLGYEQAIYYLVEAGREAVDAYRAPAPKVNKDWPGDDS